MKPTTCISILLAGICFLTATGSPSLIAPHEPIPFILDKVEKNDVVLLGTTHQQPKILTFISNLLPHLSQSGITHIGLEIASDQQDRLDRFMKTGTGLSEIRIFQGIDCREYRQLVKTIRRDRLLPVAIDLPTSMWKGGFTRDQWMAERIAGVFKKNKAPKILVIVGNLHTLKAVDWVDPTIKDQFIRYYLERTHPKLGVYSVVSSINDSPEDCDFQKWFGRNSKPVGIETLVFDGKLGLTRIIAAKSMTAHDAVDAVIVF